MPLSSWQANSTGYYWIDVMLGNRAEHLMVDLGLVDPLHRVGVEVEAGMYDQLNQAGQLSHHQLRDRRDASGRMTRVATGLTTLQLHDPVQLHPIGPRIDLYVSRGGPNTPNRVGVEFFHHLQGCVVHWNLDSQTWCVEYP